ncbi:MAG: aminotransferase family protein [Acidimicrobiales bacterium]
MAATRHAELTITRGDGCWVWDEAGRRYLDATASLWYANVGHNRAEICGAIAEQAAVLPAYSTFGDFSNRPAHELADRLADLAPLPGARIFFGSGGGDAIETAAKLARHYWAVSGRAERMHIITRDKSYHGTHGFGTSIAGIEANRTGYGPLFEGHSTVAFGSAGALEAEIDRLGDEHVAAFFFEPVIGAGGVYPPPPGYVEAVADVCARHDVLLVADSVICGFGRLGDWFGIERWDIRPDMITFAKGVTSGYLPLGGVVVSERVAEPFWDQPGKTFRHGPTYAGHPTCCAAALANIGLLERDGLVGRGRELEGDLMRHLSPLAGHELVAEVRGGVGLLAAVELAPDLLASRPAAPRELQMLLRERGVLVRPLATAMAVSPPLIVDDGHLALVADSLASGRDALARRLPV